MLASIIRFLLIIAIFGSSLILPSVNAQEESVTCYKTDETIELDGKWTTNKEWSNALNVSMRFNPTLAQYGYIENGTIYAMIKHDGKQLYILIEAITSTNASGKWNKGWDFYGICIDPNNQKSEYPMTDDLYIHRTWREGISRYWITKGMGDIPKPGWDWSTPKHEPVYMKHSLSASPFSDTEHVVCEFSIPLEILSDQIGLGIIAVNWDSKTTNTWPEDWLENAPDTWGTLNISSEKQLVETPTPSPSSTPTPTETPTATPTETPTITPTPIEKVEEISASTESFITQIPGGYLGILGVVIVIAILLMAVVLLRKRK